MVLLGNFSFSIRSSEFSRGSADIPNLSLPTKEQLGSFIAAAQLDTVYSKQLATSAVHFREFRKSVVSSFHCEQSCLCSLHLRSESSQVAFAPWEDSCD